MSLDNRGMSISQAKALAADPQITPGVMVRLANGYPEVRDILLANPALYPELRAWLENAKVAPVQPQTPVVHAARPVQPVPVAKPVKVSTHTPKRKRRRGPFAKAVATFLPALLTIGALGAAVSYAVDVAPEPGVIVAQDIRRAPSGNYIWNYDMSVSSDSDCTDYSVKTYDQDLAVVLVQNDIAQKKCRDLKDATPSTLALLNTKTGREYWKIDFADELEWTKKWRKEVVEVPGLNEILVKFIDINGQDADGTPADGDNKGMKLKTLVPYSKLTGRVTDPVIAQSTAQPPMKSGVIEVIPIPNNNKEILLMTNGANKDFRYAKYRSKKLTDENWHYESNLQPLGGTPLVGTRLILGRNAEDTPVALRIRNGKAETWNGEAGGSIFNVGSSSIHIDGKAVSNKLNNVDAQKHRDVTITGIDNDGQVIWSIDCTGYALARSETVSTLSSRTRYSELYALTGSANRTVERIDPRGGTSIWRSEMKSKFEISRLSSPNFGAVYLTSSGSDADSMRFFSLANGELTSSIDVPNVQTRVDGYSAKTAFMVDEPQRDDVNKDIEDGKDITVKRETKKGSRTCVLAYDLASASKLWSKRCNQDEHIARVGGNWMLVDTTAGGERLAPLIGYRSGGF